MIEISAARMSGSISRADALNLISQLAAHLADPRDSSDYFPVTMMLDLATDTEGGDPFGYLSIGWRNAASVDIRLDARIEGVDVLEAEAQAADDAWAARVESSYLMGR